MLKYRSRYRRGKRRSGGFYGRRNLFSPPAIYKTCGVSKRVWDVLDVGMKGQILNARKNALRTATNRLIDQGALAGRPVPQSVLNLLEQLDSVTNGRIAQLANLGMV